MIGVDLVYLPEFKKQLDLGGPAFLSKTFTKLELKNCQSEHLAGIWAAKEAVKKILDNPAITMNQIAITYSENGQPVASLATQKFEVSISHHGDYTVAVAMGPQK